MSSQQNLLNPLVTFTFILHILGMKTHILNKRASFTIVHELRHVPAPSGVSSVGISPCLCYLEQIMENCSETIHLGHKIHFYGTSLALPSTRYSTNTSCSACTVLNQAQRMQITWSHHSWCFSLFCISEEQTLYLGDYPWTGECTPIVLYTSDDFFCSRISCFL